MLTGKIRWKTAKYAAEEAYAAYSKQAIIIQKTLEIIEP